MPARNRVPSFQIASGTTNERDNSYNIPTGSIFFNTDTSNIELSGNVVASDISGLNKITFTDGAFMTTAVAGAEWFSGYDSSPYGFASNTNCRFVNMNSSANVSFVDNGSGTGQQDGAVFSVNSDTAGTWVIGFTGMNLYFNNYAIFYLYDRGSIKGYIYNKQVNADGFQNVNGLWTLNLTAGQKICIRGASNGSSNIQHESTGFWGIRLG